MYISVNKALYSSQLSVTVSSSAVASIGAIEVNQRVLDACESSSILTQHIFAPYFCRKMPIFFDLYSPLMIQMCWPSWKSAMVAIFCCLDLSVPLTNFGLRSVPVTKLVPCLFKLATDYTCCAYSNGTYVDYVLSATTGAWYLIADKMIHWPTKYISSGTDLYCESLLLWVTGVCQKQITEYYIIDPQGPSMWNGIWCMRAK